MTELAFDAAYNEVLKSVRTTLIKAPGPVRDLAAHMAESAGKGIRAKLLIACAMSSNTAVPEDAVRAASAVELLHMASLVHDDIIDEADTRRNVTAAHSKFGKEKAVLYGDWLLCAALRHAASVNRHSPSA